MAAENVTAIRDRVADYDPAIIEIRKTLQKAEATQADPEVIEGLKRALQYADLRDEYAHKCTSEHSATCGKIAETTLTHPWRELKDQGQTMGYLRPVMMSGRLEGQLLKSLVSGQRARRVLEVGMYTGYSALSMAEALPEDGRLVTLDVEPYLAAHNRPYFDQSPHGKKIEIKIGNALEMMKELSRAGEQFDFMFLDADKSEYIDYLKLAIDGGLLAENGTIAVDNAYRFGASYLPREGPPDVSRVFGEHVINDQRLHKVLIPVRDGILLIRRLAEVEGSV